MGHGAAWGAGGAGSGPPTAAWLDAVERRTRAPKPALWATTRTSFGTLGAAPPPAATARSTPGPGSRDPLLAELRGAPAMVVVAKAARRPSAHGSGEVDSLQFSLTDEEEEGWVT